ncbi:MAG TPA: hypothetical protein VEI52_11055 [Terriglobales bacterium]|nr:hypothetical protein [Terriglobales bacterium]
MKASCDFVVRCSSVMLLIVTLSGYSASEERNKYICSEPNPESMCTAKNTCGSATAPCTIDVKRTADSAAVTPDIPGAKSNAPFCVKSGTTITWKSLSKNTGFVVDFGPSAPFEPAGAAIIGGSDRSPSVVAKKPGCYKFSTGACVSGAAYGMCASVDTELVVTGGN